MLPEGELHTTNMLKLGARGEGSARAASKKILSERGGGESFCQGLHCEDAVQKKASGSRGKLSGITQVGRDI